MNFYGDISYWENRNRVSLLRRFRDLVITYYNNSHSAHKERFEINMELTKVQKIIHLAEVNTSIVRTPPPAIGGRIIAIDLLNDIFNLGRHDIPFSYLVDTIERSIGVYENDRSRAMWRTMFPLWWLKRLIVGVGRFPFLILTSMGLNIERVESSLIGKLIKGLLSLLAAFASLLLIAERLGFLSDIMDILGLSQSDSR